jgi:hypothetical protein
MDECVWRNSLHADVFFSSATALLDHIRGSGNQSTTDGYMIYSHQFQSREPTSAFRALQTSIVNQLHAIRSLLLFMAFVHPDLDGHSVLCLVNNLSQTGWVTASTRMDFTSYGNTIVGHTTIIVGIHNSTESSVEKIQFKTPSRKLPLHLNSLIWRNFNKVKYGISYGCEDDDFEKEPQTGSTASLPYNLISISISDGVKPLYFHHAVGSDTSILAGAMVITWDSLCPSFTSAPNCNIFQSHFGVKFLVKGKQYVHRFSSFVYTSC